MADGGLPGGRGAQPFPPILQFHGKRAREFMAIYYDAQEKMSASAVQYVRGMPVAKIFGQSVRSFRQFNTEIQAYKTFALKCCDTYQNGMIAFTVLLNSMVTFILPMGILLLQASPQSLSLAVVWLFLSSWDRVWLRPFTN